MDRTVVDRVRKYRSAQKAKRNIARVEVQVPACLSEDLKAIGAGFRTKFSKLTSARRHIDLVLGTINAPRPLPINDETLLKCLLTPRPDQKWRPHIEAFFDEVSEEAIHDIVLAGAVDFEDLYRAARVWRVTHGKRVSWIKEMADLTLAASPA